MEPTPFLSLWSNTRSRLQVRHVPWHEATRVTPNAQLMVFIRNPCEMYYRAKQKSRETQQNTKGREVWNNSTVTMAGLNAGMYYDEHFRPKRKLQPIALKPSFSGCGSHGLLLVTTWREWQYSFYVKLNFSFLIQGQFNNSGFERKFHLWIQLLIYVIKLWGYFVVTACCFDSSTSSLPATSTCVSCISDGLPTTPKRTCHSYEVAHFKGSICNFKKILVINDTRWTTVSILSWLHF